MPKQSFISSIVFTVSLAAGGALAQDVVVTNPPSDPAYVQPSADTYPVIASKAAASSGPILDVGFRDLVVPNGYRLIIDFVSVRAEVQPNQRPRVFITPCYSSQSPWWGYITMPLTFAGSDYIGDTRHSDIFGGNIAMHTYMDPGCNANVGVRVDKGGSNVIVTIQGHWARTAASRF